MLNIAVCVSGGGTDLQSIIDACEAGKINGQIRLVISNRKKAYGLESRPVFMVFRQNGSRMKMRS